MPHEWVNYKSLRAVRLSRSCTTMGQNSRSGASNGRASVRFLPMSESDNGVDLAMWRTPTWMAGPSC
jgi:hypothetical protein